MKAMFQRALKSNGITLSETQAEQLLVFLDQLLRWNKVFRLTAISDPDQAIWLHLIDSLVILPFLHGNRIVDVGSGGGLPGIPLAITCPNKEFVLLDSNGKKTRFLQQAVVDLKLANVTVIQSRVEIFHPALGFDSIMTRAFATLSLMLQQTKHLSRAGGQFLAMKGAYPEDELAALPADYSAVSVHRLSINGLDAERHLVCIQKV